MQIKKIVYINKVRKCIVFDFQRSISYSHYLPYVRLQYEYRSQLDVSLPPEDDSKFLACCVLSENLEQFDFWESQFHPLKTNTHLISNGPRSISPWMQFRRTWRPGTWSTSYPPTTKLLIQISAGNETYVLEAPSCMNRSSQGMISRMSAKKSAMLFYKKLCNSTL
jgi:hypothetical protein